MGRAIGAVKVAAGGALIATGAGTAVGTSLVVSGAADYAQAES